MNPAVTVDTTFAAQECAGQVIPGAKSARMLDIHMTLLAEIGQSPVKERTQIRAVRVMAVDAIFPYRRVLP